MTAGEVEKNAQTIKRVAQGKRSTPVYQEKVGGDVEAEKAGDEGDGFVKIRNPKREEEERKKKEEEEKKKKEEEAKKAEEEKEGGGEKGKEDKGDEGKGKEKGGDEA